MDITDYTHLSIGEIVSGYINQVQSSRDLGIDMVKQIQHKSEVKFKLLLWIFLTAPAPKSIAYDEYVVDLERTYNH